MDDSHGENGRKVERCAGLIRAFLLRHPYGPRAVEVDDCLQEAKVKLWKTLENGHDIEDLAAYVRKISDSIVCDHLHRAIRERELLSSAAGRAMAENQAVCGREDDHRRELIEEVRTALDSLVMSRRTVLQLTMSGLSLQEIAATRRWSRKKTYHLYERGIEDLRRLFGEKRPRP